MNRAETCLPGVVVLEPRVYGDSRGFFLESYSLRSFSGLGITCVFVQDNHSMSVRNTLRGLHYQLEHAQSKLCRVIAGEVLDVAVDIRCGSPTFGRWTSVVLSAENKKQIFIPAGYAHGFRVLSETAEFLYKCDNYYAPDDEHGIAWDDPLLAIEWGVISPPLISEKDARLPQLSVVQPHNLPVFQSTPSAGE